MVYYPGIFGAALEPTTPPTFVAAGAGANQSADTSDLAPGAPAGIVSGDILIAQVSVRSSVSGTSVATPAGWAAPIYNDVTASAVFTRQVLFQRTYDGVFGMPTFDWDGAAGTNIAARARLYAFRGADGSNEGAASVQTIANAVGSIPGVTTTGANRLVVAFAANTSNLTAGNATGETGGDYTELVAAYVTGSPNMSIHAQSAVLAVAGTITGGVITVASGTPNWICRAFGLPPT